MTIELSWSRRQTWACCRRMQSSRVLRLLVLATWSKRKSSRRPGTEKCVTILPPRSSLSSTKSSTRISVMSTSRWIQLRRRWPMSLIMNQKKLLVVGRFLCRQSQWWQKRLLKKNLWFHRRCTTTSYRLRYTRGLKTKRIDIIELNYQIILWFF